MLNENVGPPLRENQGADCHHIIQYDAFGFCREFFFLHPNLNILWRRDGAQMLGSLTNLPMNENAAYIGKTVMFSKSKGKYCWKNEKWISEKERKGGTDTKSRCHCWRVLAVLTLFFEKNIRTNKYQGKRNKCTWKRKKKTQLFTSLQIQYSDYFPIKLNQKRISH